MLEVWIDVKMFENVYQVSNFGNIRSKDRYVKGKNGHMVLKKGQLRKLQPMKCGYLGVMLVVHGVYKMFYVHRLVAEAFLPNLENFPCINHKDCDKHNNLVWVNEDGSVDVSKSNIEWCTYKYNSQYEPTKQKRKDALLKKYGYESEEERIEERKRKQKEYREEHHDEILERERAFRDKNRDKLRAGYKEFYEKNKEKKLAWMKEHYSTPEGKEKRRKSNRNFREKYPLYNKLYQECYQTGDFTPLKEYVEQRKKEMGDC